MRHRKLLTNILTCLLILLFAHTAEAASKQYVIVLASAADKNNSWHVKQLDALQGLTVFITSVTVKGRPWERLNAGFLKSRKEALSRLAAIKRSYPNAWLKTATSDDLRAARQHAINANTTKRKDHTEIVSSHTGQSVSLSDRKLEKLMRQAKTELRNKQYRKAIRLFSAIDLAGESQYSREALELLGVARQRNNQKAQAAKAWQKYLDRYPDSNGATRVRQRLTGLLTATRAPRKSITLRSTDKVATWDTFGSLSQYYRHDQTDTTDTGSVATQSQLITFADYTAIQRLETLENRFQITLDNTYDFLDTTNRSEFRLTELFYDISTRTTGTSARLGRQSLRIGSLLNRFDGINAGYQLTADIRISLLAGRPVEVDDKTSLNKHKSFWGYIFESGTFLRHWNLNLFHFEHKIDGFDDRISTGAELQYRSKDLIIFSMMDYDTLYNALNAAYINANLNLNSRQSVHLNVFKRTAPPLSTANALIGQTAPSIKELAQTLNIEQIYQLARQRTAESETLTVGGTQRLRKDLQANVDLTLTHTGGTDASPGVAATPSTGTDTFISAQLVGTNLILKNDTGVLGFRYFDTKASDTLSLIINSRIPLARDWRLYPRLQFDLRNIRNGGTQRKLRGLFKADYRLKRNLRFDMEIGYDDTSNSSNNQSLGSNSLFYTLGYRYDF